MDDVNVAIAKLLGWVDLYDTRWADESGNIVKAVCGTNPQGLHDCIQPDYTHDLNAVVAALPDGYELSLSKQGNYYHAGIEPTIYGLVATGWGHADKIGYADSAARALLTFLQASAASEVK